ncbi:uncharacterized protein LOC113514464 isoform X1 [Galleria mellonella]|uniref:Uncharacterized protein LOC113514464 isoform X1 n=2 Tax=Galleria mellonella TaxID=7137 RepID=A0ABM3MCA3_GALME|nr:uncharacterized protein LOC113514464 isoform X1 [Galleria mellonella]
MSEEIKLTKSLYRKRCLIRLKYNKTICGSGDVIYYSNENKLNVTLRQYNFPEGAWNILVTVGVANGRNMNTIFQQLIDNRNDMTTVFVQDINTCWDGYMYNVVLLYKNGQICDFHVIFTLVYEEGDSMGTLHYKMSLDWNNTCRGPEKKYNDGIAGERYLHTCILGNEKNRQFVDFYQKLNIGQDTDLVAMRIPDNYIFKYKMELYSFDNNTKFDCKTYTCNSANQCTVASTAQLLLVKPSMKDSLLHETNEEEFYYVPNKNYTFNFIGYMSVHVDTNGKIIAIARQNTLVFNTSIFTNLILTEKDENTKLYYLNFNCIVKTDKSIFECSRQITKNIRFIIKDSQPNTTEAPLQPHIGVYIKKKSRLHYKCTNPNNNGSFVRLSQILNYGAYLETFNYSANKYPVLLNMNLTEFDNNTILSCAVSQTDTDSKQIMSNYTIIVSSDNVTKSVDVKDIYYNEHKDILLNCIGSYWIKVDENNIIQSVIYSSKDHNITLNRNDNNTKLFCVKITCTFIAETNKCLRTFKKFRFILNENPQTNKSFKGGVIAGFVIGLVVFSVMARITYRRLRDNKIKQRNKTRPLPAIPVPREPVPYHHYEVIDNRFA